MEKNYYQILQVDSNASSEIIDKAYKTLIKKYHPDLQTEENKVYATEMIKKLNEAYEVLSNDEKRRLYDINLNKNNISIEEYNNLYNQNIELKNQLNNNMNKQENIVVNNNYKENYNNYKQQYSQKTPHEKFLDVLAMFITIIIVLLLFKIPFIKHLFFNMISIK